jgi:predicted RNase H-like HicB family nuclease
MTQAESREGALSRIQEAMHGWLSVMREEHPDLPETILAIEVAELEVAV